MDVAGVAAALGPTVVAVVALRAESTRQRAAFRHERSLRDREALRVLLDETATTLNEAKRAASGIESAAFTYGFRLVGEHWDVIASAQNTADRLALMRTRLAVLLGHSHATETLHRIEQRLWDVITAARGMPTDPAAGREAHDEIRETAAAFHAEAAEFDDAAAAAAGAQLRS